MCRRFLYSTDLESYPRNYALEAALDERDRRFADTTGSELDPSTLRITEEVLGEGGTGVVKAGELKLGAVNIQVTLLATTVWLPVQCSDVSLRAGCCQNASCTGGYCSSVAAVQTGDLGHH